MPLQTSNAPSGVPPQPLRPMATAAAPSAARAALAVPPGTGRPAHADPDAAWRTAPHTVDRAIDGAQAGTADGTEDGAGAHVLLALRSDRQLGTLQTALDAVGCPADAVQLLTWSDGVAERQPPAVGPCRAGSGRTGSDLRWLLVRVRGEQQVRQLGRLARLYGASAAQLFRTRVAESLL